MPVSPGEIGCSASTFWPDRCSTFPCLPPQTINPTVRGGRQLSGSFAVSSRANGIATGRSADPANAGDGIQVREIFRRKFILREAEGLGMTPRSMISSSSKSLGRPTLCQPKPGEENLNFTRNAWRLLLQAGSTCLSRQSRASAASRFGRRLQRNPLVRS
jgi:hypothetical protein